MKLNNVWYSPIKVKNLLGCTIKIVVFREFSRHDLLRSGFYEKAIDWNSRSTIFTEKQKTLKFVETWIISAIKNIFFNSVWKFPVFGRRGQKHYRKTGM